MDYPILFCDRPFLRMTERLKKKEISVTVHSVFQKAVNLESEGHLYTMLAAGTKPLTPEEDAYLGVPNSAYVKTEHFMTISFEPGMQIPGGRQEIQTGKDRFLFAEHMVLFPDAFFRPEGLREADEKLLGQGIKRFDRLLPKAAGRKGPGAGLFYINYFLGKAPDSCHEDRMSASLQKELEKRLSCVCRLMETGEEQEKQGQLRQAVAGAVGTGLGLTPSADDFFCGMLIAMACMSKTEEKVKWAVRAVEAGIRRALDKKRTTQVSGEMLLLHTQKIFPRLYKKLAEAFLTGGTGMEAALERLERIGHSSGIDMACGMASAFRILGVQRAEKSAYH